MYSAMSSVKQTIKTILRSRLGLEVHRFRPNSEPAAQIVSSLKRFDIDLVFDVGANRGQFAQKIRSGGYDGNIVSFEPLSGAYSELLGARDGDAKWDIYPRCALGGYNGEIEINIAANSASSSILPMLDSHLSAAPHTAYVARETVPLRSLDSVAPDFIEKFRNPILKIDTQGFEWEVLDGAQVVLPHMRGLLIELSLTPLYEGQHLWEEIIGRLKREGFNLWAIQPEFIDPRDGRTLQVNGIFFRHR